MKKLRILIDSDGILADLLQDWLGTLNQKYSSNIRKEHIFSHKVSECIEGLTTEEVVSIIAKPGIFQNLNPLPGAIDALNELRYGQGHDVTIVSSPSDIPHVAMEKYIWLWNHFGLSYKDIILGNKKFLVKGDVFIDDNPDQITNYRAAWPEAKILTIAYPYNKCVKDLVDLRAPGFYNTEAAWSSILEKIKGIAYENE